MSQSSLEYVYRCDTTAERSPCTDQVPPKLRNSKKLVNARVTHQKHDYPTAENQPESWINEAISLMSIGDSFVKLTRNEELNILHLHLARDGH